MDGVYNVLDTRSIEERHGRFDEKDLERIWGEEKYVDKHPELLALMKNYELCFEIPGTRTYIAPELLAADPKKYKPINTDHMKKLRKDAYLSMLLPLIFEIERDVDPDPRALYSKKEPFTEGMLAMMTFLLGVKV